MSGPCFTVRPPRDKPRRKRGRFIDQPIVNDFAEKVALSYESEPTFTLERQVAMARQELGEDRWAVLMAEWEAK